MSGEDQIDLDTFRNLAGMAKVASLAFLEMEGLIEVQHKDSPLDM